MITSESVFWGRCGLLIVHVLSLGSSPAFWLHNYPCLGGVSQRHVLRWLLFVPRSMNENIRLAEIVEAVKELEQAIVKDSGVPRELT